jgi:putative transposase
MPQATNPVMPKGLTRYQHSGGFHFLTFSCYRRQPLLESSSGYSAFESTLESLRIHYGFVIAGYVLMPEHVHLLTGEPAKASLAIVLQILKQETSRQLKRCRETPFWQMRYYDFNVRTEAKTIEKLKYMHRNPVRRRLADRPEDWRWSSFRHYATGERGTVEIESHWTARRRELDSGLSVGDL